MTNQFSRIHSQFFLQQGNKLNEIVAEKVAEKVPFPAITGKKLTLKA